MNFIRNLIASVQFMRLQRAERKAWRQHDARTDEAARRFVRGQITAEQRDSLYSLSVDLLCHDLNDLGLEPEPYDHSADAPVTLADLAF